MRLVEELSDFANNSSIHGLNYIVKSSSSTLVRITWFILFTSAMIYAGLRISNEFRGKEIGVFLHELHTGLTKNVGFLEDIKGCGRNQDILVLSFWRFLRYL